MMARGSTDPCDWRHLAQWSLGSTSTLACTSLLFGTRWWQPARSQRSSNWHRDVLRLEWVSVGKTDTRLRSVGSTREPVAVEPMPRWSHCGAYSMDTRLTEMESFSTFRMVGFSQHPRRGCHWSLVADRTRPSNAPVDSETDGLPPGAHLDAFARQSHSSKRLAPSGRSIGSTDSNSGSA